MLNLFASIVIFKNNFLGKYIQEKTKIKKGIKNITSWFR